MRYHLIGDQGVSMRAIRIYLESLGHIVSGSDLKNGGHNAKNIIPDINVVVRTSAANSGSPAAVEIAEAERLGIRIMRRSEILQEITKGKRLIAVSGMHGKSTITTMAGLLLIEAGFDPTIFVGADVKEINGVAKIGKSDWFVMEACEYDRAFLDFYPEILILSNIEEEHLDTYPGGLAEIKAAFTEYINHVPDDGIIIANYDDENIRLVLEKISTKAKIIFYGLKSEKYNKLNFTLSVPGKHNVLNALSVVALADQIGISQETVGKVLSQFTNADRRFQLLGNYNGSDLIDDYGHHPTEIKATISALAEKYPDKKKIVVFWPHQYKRIKSLFEQFSASFDEADFVILKPIYFVPGRDEIIDISSEQLAKEIEKNGVTAECIKTDEEIVEYLKNNLNKDSVLLTIGIPPVYKIINKILESK